MADVFISYHEKSAGGLAEEIAKTLEAHGITCWYAKRDIPTGGDFARIIPPQIDACKVFLLILNESAKTSRHIENELGLAFSRWSHNAEITILPLEIGNVLWEPWMRYYLIHTQGIQIPVLDADRMQEIVQQVGKLLNCAPQMVKRGKCGAWGNNVTFILNENGILTISGKGDMQDFRREVNAPWQDKKGTIFHVEIQYGVATIGSLAFSGCARLRTVNISGSVTTIGWGAFKGCIGLISAPMPDGVTAIEDMAFHGCHRLTNVTIPDSVNFIGHGAFHDCKELKSVSVSENTQIAMNAFPHNVIVTRRT